ncbi:transducin family protein / WD-40 repeat family protein [Raphanus sativus]|nr:transducin family protein / WD-40 repeat family protein [Raphanus sativus]
MLGCFMKPQDFDSIAFCRMDKDPPSGRDLKDCTLSPNGLVKASEFIRLIIDALTSLGFNAIATDLENQSRIPLHSPATKQFLELVKNREWDKSIDALKQLQLPDETPVRLLLLEQKYLEFLKNQNVPEALKTIRKRYNPRS